MKNISFMLTTAQIHARTKTITRRLGWLDLKAGDLLCGVEKGQGLKPGEKINRLCTIRVVSVRRECLGRMLVEPEYGQTECALEGFPEMEPAAFVAMFCDTHKGCTPTSEVTRIKFSYAVPDEFLTHFAKHAEPQWLAIHRASALELLKGYDLTEAERTDIALLMMGYCNLLERAGLLHYGATEAEAIAAAAANNQVSERAGARSSDSK